MLEFLILVFIFLFFSIRSQSSQSTIPNLEKKGFSNISLLYKSSTFNIYSAIYKGDNHAILIPTATASITNGTINILVDTSVKAHLHNKIIVLFNNTISKSANQKIQEYDISLLHYNTLKSNSETAITTFYKPIYKRELDDNCKIDSSSFDPIQEGKADTSLFRLLFNNKIEKL